MQKLRVYYSTSGGSGNLGTEGDPVSRGEAITRAHAFIAAGGDKVFLIGYGGDYPPLSMTSLDNRIEFRNYPKQEVRVFAGQRIPGSWTGPDADGVYTKSVTGTFRDLYVGDIRATRARSTDVSTGDTNFTLAAHGWTDAASKISALARPQDVELVGTNFWKMFRVRVASAVGTSVTVADPDWADSQYHKNLPSYDFSMNMVRWYENAKELVKNGTGYWYHDRNASMLYYKPRAGEVMGTVEVIAGQSEEALSFVGDLDDTDRQLSFRGIKLGWTTYLTPDSYGMSPLQATILVRTGGDTYAKTKASVNVNKARGVEFHGCTIKHCGGDGLGVEFGSKDVGFYNGVIDDTGGNGVNVGDVTHYFDDPFPTDDREILERITIENNLFQNIAEVQWSGIGIFGAYGKNFKIKHNELNDLPYTAISLGFGWGYNDYQHPFSGSHIWPIHLLLGRPSPSRQTVQDGHEVQYNKVVNYGKKLDDNGGIYLVGAMPNTSAKGNYVYTQSVKFPFHQSYYLDNGCSGVTLEDNVADGFQGRFINAQYGVPFARNCTIRNNWANQGSILPANITDYGHTMGTNTVGALGATPLAIKQASGRY